MSKTKAKARLAYYSLDVAKAQIKQRQEEKAMRTGKAKRAARRAEHEAIEGAKSE